MVRRVPRFTATSLTILAAATLACHRAHVLPSPDMLASQVTIRRDTFGIPHILARSEEAAAFAFGYAQAEDHALEIVRRMIRARGEGAKYFGAEALENDLAMAHFDNIGEAQRGLDAVSPLFRRIVMAYAAGVNRYLEQHRDEMPEWVTLVTPADVLANSRAGAVNALAGNALRQQLRNKYSGTGSAVDSTESYEDESAGSNAFALGGTRTVSGKPILLGNPHLSWSSLYWEAHVRVPGRIDFYGSTLVGIPVLRAGFNDRLGFVTTNNAPDLDDVYALSMDPERPDHYLLDGRSIPMTRRDVTIHVRSSDGSMRQDSRAFWTTPIGPVVFRTPSHAFAVKSSRLQAHRYFEGFYVLSKARSLGEWLAAMRLNLVPTSNFTYADVDGNILYQWNGQVPLRPDPNRDYSLDVPATSIRDIWARLHRVDDYPRLLNPPGGYIQNANNPPAFVSARDQIDMSGFPQYFERGSLALRPQLALELLESQSKFSVDDVIRAKYDTRMLLAARVLQPVIDAVRTAHDAPALARAGADVLAAWDGTVAAESRGGVLFQRFWDGYARRVRQPFARPWDTGDPIRTPSGIRSPEIAVEELATAVRETRQNFGSEAVAWGHVHRFRIGSIDLPGDGATGTYGCFRVLRFDPLPGEHAASRPPGIEQAAPEEKKAPAARWPPGVKEAAREERKAAGNLEPTRPLAGFGDAWVLLVDFATPVVGWSVLAYGQTTNLASPHSRDQIDIFARHALRRAWYTEADIMANLERAYQPH